MNAGEASDISTSETGTPENRDPPSNRRGNRMPVYDWPGYCTHDIGKYSRGVFQAPKSIEESVQVPKFRNESLNR